MRLVAPWFSCLVVLAGPVAAADEAVAPAQPQASLFERWLAADKMEWLSGSVHLALLSTSISTPILRPASGHGELAVPQTTRAWSPRLSGFLGAGNFGIEGGISWLQTDLTSFEASDFAVGAPGEAPTRYANPSWRLISVDLMLHWLPLRWLPVDLYGVLGMADWAYSYQVSGATFPEWNGAKGDNEFTYGYGLGLRLMPIRYVSLLAEIRWMQGDSSTALTDCTPIPDEPGWSWCHAGPSETKSSTRLVSIGAAVNFP